MPESGGAIDSITAHVDGGAGFETVLTAAAVAEPRWREVFHVGMPTTAAWRAAGGSALIDEVVSIGRSGWLNLAGLLAQERSGGSLEAVRALIERLAPERLQAVLAGSRAEHSALTGRGRSRWLAGAEPEAVRARLLGLCDRLPAVGTPPDLEPTRALLAAEGPRGVLRKVAPGVEYAEGSLADVVFVASHAITPIIAEIDVAAMTLIVHPPLLPVAPVDSATRLQELARVAGDGVRMRILVELRAGARTLPELCAALGKPRTTLLHHLAMLRGAGLIDVAVTSGEPNSYRLEPSGFADFAVALRAFAADSAP